MKNQIVRFVAFLGFVSMMGGCSVIQNFEQIPEEWQATSRWSWKESSWQNTAFDGASIKMQSSYIDGDQKIFDFKKQTVDYTTKGGDLVVKITENIVSIHVEPKFSSAGPGPIVIIISSYDKSIMNIYSIDTNFGNYSDYRPGFPYNAIFYGKCSPVR